MEDLVVKVLVLIKIIEVLSDVPHLVFYVAVIELVES
jgi:hypothetical protein